MTTPDLAQQIKAQLDDHSLRLINQWLEDGKTIAVYENVELGHPECGHRQYITTRQFKQEPFNGVPPQTLPDWGDSINWRYQLVGTYSGPAL